MTKLKRGKQSFIPASPVYLQHWSSIAGKKEAEGPLKSYFDETFQDALLGERSWEQAEQKMQLKVLRHLEKKSCTPLSQLGPVISGDLLNQCIGSSFTLRNRGIPHLGLYGACSTMAEGLLVATMAVSAGFTDRAIAMTSSHFAASERQYRFPLGYGGQRTPTSQWTVTGCGGVIVGRDGPGPRITACTIGSVVDLSITDANNMGAAMAPAAFDTIRQHMLDLGTHAEDYDLIVTGDLGQLGKELLLILAQKADLPIAGKLMDCGTTVFDVLGQDVHAGGSGCGCSAVTLCGYLLEQLKSHSLKKILFCGTGALLSPTSCQQGLPIPGICHAVSIEGA